MQGVAGLRRYTWPTAVIAAAVLVIVVAAAWSTHSSTPSAQTIRSPQPSRTPPGADHASLIVTIRIGTDGTLAVTEQLTHPPATTPVAISAPLTVQGPGIPTGQQAHPQLTELTGSAAGKTITPIPSGVQRWTIARPAQGAQLVTVSYRVHGTVLRSEPAPAGRAIEVITPVLLAAATPGRVQVTVSATAPVVILGLNCPRAQPANVVCGQNLGKQWQATFGPGGSTDAQLLTAQVNLPP